jgi:hypothetical protein
MSQYKELKDVMGNSIDVGDTIVYASSPYGSPRITLGTVVALLPERGRVQVERRCASGGSVKDGLARKWVWDNVNMTGNFNHVPATKVYITMFDRCLVLKKGVHLER